MIRNRQARAFSLLELMIAIMVMGIGMIMIGTVFPVGLDMTRGTVQMSIGLDAAESAAMTVGLRVPSWKDPNNNTLINRLAATARPVGVGPDVDENAVVTQQEYQNYPGGVPKRFHGERTRWNGDLVPGPASYLYKAAATNTTFVLPTINLSADYRAFADTNPVAALLRERVPSVVPPPDQPYVDIGQDPCKLSLDQRPMLQPDVLLTAIDYCVSDWPYMYRITAGERVFPAVQPPFVANMNPLAVMYTPNADDVAVTSGYIHAIASRSYSWTVIHRLLEPVGSQRQFALTVVVSYRGNASSRFSPQLDTRSNVDDQNWLRFDLRRPADRNALRQPMPLPANQSNLDTLFPQPWLVMMDEVNQGNGYVRCTAEVARLMPAGSYFVVARSINQLRAGTTIEVLSRTWDPGELGKAPDQQNRATLQIARGSGGGAAVPVWIIPPAIEKHPTGSKDFGEFSERTPVIGVYQRKVTAS